VSEKDFRIRLDLNENPYDISGLLKNEIGEGLQQNNFNRYPDPSGLKLKESISKYVDLDCNCIAIGNGSDELITLIIQAFLKKNDKILLHKPTFSMYKHYANIVDATILEYETDRNFELNINAFKTFIEKEKPKIIIICNPNNPTGKLLEVWQIEEIAKGYEGLLLVDEAYIEFCNKSSIKLLKSYKNIIILRTFSKAFGLAGLRVGYMLASSETIERIEKIRSPFNINAFSQSVAALVLENFDKVKSYIDIIKDERKRLYKRLSEMKELEVFESQANFILIRSNKKQLIYEGLLENGIKVRCFENEMLNDCLRITVGTPFENDELIKILEVI